MTQAAAASRTGVAASSGSMPTTVLDATSPRRASRNTATAGEQRRRRPRRPSATRLRERTRRSLRASASARGVVRIAASTAGARATATGRIQASGADPRREHDRGRGDGRSGPGHGEQQPLEHHRPAQLRCARAARRRESERGAPSPDDDLHSQREHREEHAEQARTRQREQGRGRGDLADDRLDDLGDAAAEVEPAEVGQRHLARGRRSRLRGELGDVAVLVRQRVERDPGGQVAERERRLEPEEGFGIEIGRRADRRRLAGLEIHEPLRQVAAMHPVGVVRLDEVVDACHDQVGRVESDLVAHPDLHEVGGRARQGDLDGRELDGSVRVVLVAGPRHRRGPLDERDALVPPQIDRQLQDGCEPGRLGQVGVHRLGAHQPLRRRGAITERGRQSIVEFGDRGVGRTDQGVEGGIGDPLHEPDATGAGQVEERGRLIAEFGSQLRGAESFECARRECHGEHRGGDDDRDDHRRADARPYVAGVERERSQP